MATYSKRKVVVKDKNDKTTSKSSNMIITVGVFFDGTLNNRFNYKLYKWTKNKKEKEKIGNLGDSYQSTYSNVAQLWASYDISKIRNHVKVYIEGPGTWGGKRVGQDTGQNEEGLASSRIGDIWGLKGAATGMGLSGVNAKIAKACSLIADKIQPIVNKSGRVTVVEIRFDVFGFSRGAAAARSFVSRMFSATGATEDFTTSLKSKLKGREFANTLFTVRFMGLFDTVSSYGAFFYNDVKDLQLKIPNGKYPKVDKVVHLVAADEYRKNFALTDITSARTRGTEIILPGAHSDVGGGYKEVEFEKYFMSGPNNWGEGKCRGYLSFKELKEGRWIPKEEAERLENIRQFNGPDVLSIYASNLGRNIYTQYSRIPLQIMHSFAKEKGMKVIPAVWDYVSKLYDSSLQSLCRDLSRLALQGKSVYRRDQRGVPYIPDSDPIKQKVLNIRYQYIHLSAKSWSTDYAAPDNVRKIYLG